MRICFPLVVRSRAHACKFIPAVALAMFVPLASGVVPLVGVGATTAHASGASGKHNCRSGALGTARVIHVDTSRYREFKGKEKALGLRRKEVILTFDDGPIAGKTPRILDALKKECVKATFFYVGRMARAYPKLVRRVVREGHTLAHHTQGHNRLPQYSSKAIASHVDKGIRALQKVAYGKASTTPQIPFFRYPYLARSKRTDAIIAKRRMVSFGANIDTLDWKRMSPSKLHDRTMAKIRREGRGIVLMHDIQARTAKMLPRLLRSLKAEGYKIVHMVPKGQPAPDLAPASSTVEVAALRLNDDTVANSTPVLAKPVRRPDIKPKAAKSEPAPVRETNDAAVAAALADAPKPEPAKPQKVRHAALAAMAEARRQARGQRVQVALSTPSDIAGIHRGQLVREPTPPAPTPALKLAPNQTGLQVLTGVKKGKPVRTLKKTERTRTQASTPKAKRKKRNSTKIARARNSRNIVKSGRWKLRRSQWIIN